MSRMETVSLNLDLVLSSDRDNYGAQIELTHLLREVISEAITSRTVSVDNVEVIDFDIYLED